MFTAAIFVDKKNTNYVFTTHQEDKSCSNTDTSQLTAISAASYMFYSSIRYFPQLRYDSYNESVYEMCHNKQGVYSSSFFSSA